MGQTIVAVDLVLPVAKPWRKLFKKEEGKYSFQFHF